MELDRIYNCDCFEFIKTLEDKSIDLVVTDCPYLHDNGNWLKSGKAGKRSLLGRTDTFAENGYIYTDMSDFGEKEIDELLTLLVPKMKIPHMFFFCSEEQVPIYGMWARNHKLHSQILVWEKPLFLINKNAFSHNAEYVVRVYDFGTAFNRLDDTNLYNKVLHDIPIKGTDKIHPTQKPTSLFRRFIKLASQEGGVIFDPFSGSGTCAVAALQENRHFICCEKNEDFYKASQRRLDAERSQLTLF